jgi:hypothetical protein
MTGNIMALKSTETNWRRSDAVAGLVIRPIDQSFPRDVDKLLQPKWPAEGMQRRAPNPHHKIS